jgi:hypothetical protein
VGNLLDEFAHRSKVSLSHCPHLPLSTMSLTVSLKVSLSHCPPSASLNHVPHCLSQGESLSLSPMCLSQLCPQLSLSQVYEDDAEFIVEVKDGRAAAEMQPEFELKNLKIRFDSWKKDFKNRLRCASLYPSIHSLSLISASISPSL